MSGFTFDRLTRALLEMKHDSETVDNLEALVTSRMADAWDQGYSHLFDSECTDQDPVSLRDNPYRQSVTA